MNGSMEVEEELIEMIEGETRELCVVLLEPEESTMFITVTVSSDATTEGNLQVEGRAYKV